MYVCMYVLTSTHVLIQEPTWWEVGMPFFMGSSSFLSIYHDPIFWFLFYYLSKLKKLSCHCVTFHYYHHGENPRVIKKFSIISTRKNRRSNSKDNDTMGPPIVVVTFDPGNISTIKHSERRMGSSNS